MAYELNPRGRVDLTYGTGSKEGRSKEDMGLVISKQGLLSETAFNRLITEQISITAWGDSHCFFQNDEDDFGFDVFAATFFLVTAYQEYGETTKDAHQRFSADSCVLQQHGILDQPLVNQWALALKDKLIAINPRLVFQPRQFSYLSTIDVDQTWKFKEKGLFRSLASSFRDVFQGKWENFKMRWPVLLGIKEDPFYNFDWQQELHNKHDINVHYFWLLGRKGPYDKNIPATNEAQARLIRDLDQAPGTSIGIHPSYRSNSEDGQMPKEKKHLEGILQRRVVSSRQHFLKHQMPTSFTALLAEGIREEHTMGYSTHLGFRLGIAAPVAYFDLETNQKTSMTLYPFCMMDITPLHYLKLSPEDAIIVLKELVDRIAAVGGMCTSLWHNESLSESERWVSWRKVYEELIRYAGSKVRTEK